MKLIEKSKTERWISNHPFKFNLILLALGFSVSFIQILLIGGNNAITFSSGVKFGFLYSGIFLIVNFLNNE